jgi:BirA family biotin operon repressor/biotin-[acetyl-CoA-carboxylase] ligase
VDMAGPSDRFSDLDRPPLHVRTLAPALETDGFLLTVLPEAASTNAEAADRARAGAPEGTVIVAESQTAGRGRQGRTWESPPRAGLTFSVVLRPPAISGWLPLLAGLSVAVALQERAGVEAGVKWPNDVLISGESASGKTSERKVAGLLAEVPAGGDGAIVIGIGLNVTTRAGELPDERATSLAIEGATTTDRGTLLKAILRSLARAYASWLAEPEALKPAYRASCVTLGRQVRVELPGGETYEGLATDIDDAGRLVVAERAFAAGDVIHLR